MVSIASCCAINAWFYDERTRLIRMTDAQSHSTRYGYDDSGHLTEVILADGRT
ncbi:RHS repeat protein, partial [Escherichia coli]